MSPFFHSEYDDHLRVSFVADPDTGLWAINAIHRPVDGRTGGGIRFRPYASDDEALTDVLRLSKAMSYKFALAGLPAGGAKTVLIGDPAKLKTPELLAAYARYVESLGGLYLAGPDIGTNADDITEMAKTTRFVAGRSDQSGTTAIPTAQGCFSALKATIKAAFGRDDFTGLRIAIQGVGGVGGVLAGMLADAGADLVVADIDQAAVDAAAALGAKVVSPDEILAADVDLLSPNAMGAVLSQASIPTIRAKAICGCANNQLATPDCAQALKDRGILWAPDYVVSAGGAIDGCKDADLITAQESAAKIEAIGATLTTIFECANRANNTTEAAAYALAQDLISQFE